MDIRRVHEEEKQGRLKWVTPTYYRYPDGQDLPGKLFFTTQMGIVIGGLTGIMFCGVQPFIRSNKVKLLTIAKYLLPTVATTATFTIVTYYATVLRKRDDMTNYFLGGAAAGMVLGSIAGGFNRGILVGVLAGSLAAGHKFIHLGGGYSTTKVNRGYSSYYMRNKDTSLVAERPGNWTREPATSH